MSCKLNVYYFVNGHLIDECDLGSFGLDSGGFYYVGGWLVALTWQHLSALGSTCGG